MRPNFLAILSDLCNTNRPGLPVRSLRRRFSRNCTQNVQIRCVKFVGTRDTVGQISPSRCKHNGLRGRFAVPKLSQPGTANSVQIHHNLLCLLRLPEYSEFSTDFGSAHFCLARASFECAISIRKVAKKCEVRAFRTRPVWPGSFAYNVLNVRQCYFIGYEQHS